MPLRFLVDNALSPKLAEGFGKQATMPSICVRLGDRVRRTQKSLPERSKKNR